MSKISMFVLVIGLVIGIAGVALFLYGTPGIQSVETVTSVGTSQDSDGNSSGDGIQVHGDWELTVSDPDGSNAIVYNFENEIYAGAFDVISRALLPSDHEKHSSVEEWSIKLSHLTSNLFPHTLCTMGFGLTENSLPDEGAVLFVDPIEKYFGKPTQIAPKGINEWHSAGITLTGSCRISGHNNSGDTNPLSIAFIEVNTKHTTYPITYWSPNVSTSPRFELFAKKKFGSEDIIPVSHDQMMSVSLNFTFE
jgi:DNA-directed RNA polymerase subunit K/omega